MAMAVKSNAFEQTMIGNHLINFVQHVRRFVSLMVSQCIVDQCTKTAAALTFNTLLALVPLVAIGLLVLKSMAVYPDMVSQVQALLIEVFSPDISANIEKYLIAFANKASGLANLSIVIFFVTALLTLNTIDRTLNSIWHVKMQRGWLLTLVIYIGILLLAPLMIGISLVVTTYIISLPYLSDVLLPSGLQTRLVGLLPSVFAVVMFTLLYKTVPNVYVAWRHALAGGLIATLLIELAKKAFTLYLTWFPTYELVYGSIAAIPLLLLWIYVSWIVVLLGAQLAYVLGQERRIHQDQGPQLVIAVQLLQILQSFPSGLTALQLQQRGDWNGVTMLDALGRLRRAGIITRSYWGRWELLSDLSELTLYDLYFLMGGVLPAAEGAWIDKNNATKGLAAALAVVNREIEQLQSVNVASLLCERGAGSPA